MNPNRFASILVLVAALCFAAGLLLGLSASRTAAITPWLPRQSNHAEIPLDSWHPFPSPVVVVSPEPTARATAGESTDNGPSPRAGESQPGASVRPRASNGSASMPAHSIEGRGSWYCSSSSRCTRGYPASCLCAAAGPALRAALPDWRGRLVQVSAGGRSVTVRLVDSCSCSAVVDLFGSAFVQLAPLSRGVVEVRVSW